MLLVLDAPPGPAVPGRFWEPPPFADRALSPNFSWRCCTAWNGSRPNVGSAWICWADSVPDIGALCINHRCGIRTDRNGRSCRLGHLELHVLRLSLLGRNGNE